MSKRPGSNRWLQRQQNDPYARQARSSHYRSRAVYKLIEIDKKDQIIRPGINVIDLGSAPGSWSQYASEKTGRQGKVVAVDLLEMQVIENVHFIQGDFTDQAVYDACLDALGNDKVDLVLSDMAPNISGIKSSDQARSLYLAELALELAVSTLRQNGDFLVKLFQGEGVDLFRHKIREHFGQMVTRKPHASRNESPEFYLLARSFRC